MVLEVPRDKPLHSVKLLACGNACYECPPLAPLNARGTDTDFKRPSQAPLFGTQCLLGSPHALCNVLFATWDSCNHILKSIL